MDGTNFIDDGIDNPLTGNTDQNTEVTSTFASAIDAQYLRVIPVTYQGHKSFRFEAYGELEHEGCESVNIDYLLETCSSHFAEIEGLGERLDNLIANSASFYGNNPDQAASAQSIFGPFDNNGYYNNYNDMWFSQNKDSLLILSLIMNILIIIFGSCICIKAGVCSKAFGAQKVRYRKVNPYASSDDENGMIVRRK